MNPKIETALHRCGRERVFSREGRDGAAVAIRWDEVRITAPDGLERMLVRIGRDLDDAGDAAARAYVGRLRDVAAALIKQADSIVDALDGNR
jgi:hypothetical protein